MMRSIILALGTVALLCTAGALSPAPTTQAGNCGAVVAPNYRVNHHQAVHVAQDFVPVVQAIPILPDFIYNSAHFARDDAHLETAKNLQQALKIIAELKAQQAKPVAVAATSEGTFPALSVGLDEPAPTTNATAPGLSPANRLQSLLQTACARCHSDADPQGGLSLRDISKLSAKQKGLIYASVKSDQMPPTRPLSPAEKAIVRTILD